MVAIPGHDGIGGARSLFPSAPGFSFHEIALPAAHYRNPHIHSLGGGWYCYCAGSWLFTYRRSDEAVKAQMSGIRKLLW
jgi:hypothetical protein